MDWSTIVITVAAVVVAVLNAYTARQNYRNGLVMKATREDARATRSDMKTLETNTNSKMDELLALTAKSSRAEGRKEGIDSVT